MAENDDYSIQIIPFGAENNDFSWIGENGGGVEVYLIAYSLGVYQANRLLQDFPKGHFKEKIAINGTAAALDIAYGISPKIFQQTIKKMSLHNVCLFLIHDWHSETASL